MERFAKRWRYSTAQHSILHDITAQCATAQHSTAYYSTLQHTRARSRGEVFEVLEFVPTPSSFLHLSARVRAMGRKGRKAQGPQREPLAERLAKVKSKEVTQEFIKENEEAFERVQEHRSHLDSREVDLRKKIQVLKALVQKGEDEDLDVSTMMEAQQTPPAKGRRPHADGVDMCRRKLHYQACSWLCVRRHAWPRSRRRS